MPKRKSPQVVIRQKFLPDTPVYGELCDAVKLNPSLDVDFKKRLTHASKAPIELDDSEIPDFVKNFLSACSKKESPDKLAQGALDLVDKGFGTHTPKFPNLNISLSDQDALIRTNTSPSTHGCTSSNTQLVRPYLCASNGTDVPYHRFLLTPVTISGTTSTIAEDIIQEGLIYQELLHHIDPTLMGALSQALRNRINNPASVLDARNPKGKHGGVRTIFWPAVNGFISKDSIFHLISPVAHTGMIAEIIMRQKRDGKNLGNQWKMLIGGTQPQNGGLLTMGLRGFVPHLLSVPPVIKPIKPLDLLKDFKALQRLTNNDGNIVRNNSKVKEARANRIKWIVDRILDDLIDPPIGNPVTPTVAAIMHIVHKQAQRIHGYVIGSDILEIFEEAAEMALKMEKV